MAMRIERLKLENFRCFEKREFEFDPQFNVIIGENGKGKTAVIDALSVGAGALLLGIDGHSAPGIEADDARHVATWHGKALTIEACYPVSVACEGQVAGQFVRWQRSRAAEAQRTDRRAAVELQRTGERLTTAIRTGASRVDLPLVARYGAGRLWRLKRDRTVKPLGAGSRLRAYTDCLDPATDLPTLMAWFAGEEGQASQDGQPGPALEATRGALSAAMDRYSDIRYEFRWRELSAKSPDGATVLFHQLSDGYRNMLAMVADIARRAADLNPHLGCEAARETAGVVLIDEIDLHLHPSWQRTVVAGLKHAFPNIQFIATTHSPFIIQSLADNELISLEAESNTPEYPYANRSIEDIAEEVMGIDMPSRSERMQALWKGTQEFQALLQQNGEATPERIAAADAKLNELMAPFAAEPSGLALYAFLDSERKAAGLGAEA